MPTLGSYACMACIHNGDYCLHRALLGLETVGCRLRGGIYLCTKYYRFMHLTESNFAHSRDLTQTPLHLPAFNFIEFGEITDC